MSISRALPFALSLLLVSVVNHSASANILLNSSFEAGSGTDADDWLEISGPSGSTTRDGAMPNTGSFAAHMQFDHITNPPAGAAYFIEQNQGANVIDNTDSFDLTFDAKVDSDNFVGTDMFYQLLWLDQDASDGGGVKGETLVSLIGAGINTTYQQFSLLGIDAPDGADSFLLRFQVSAGAVDGVANGLWVDNASLSVVGAEIPEPTTAGLLALGGLAAGVCYRGRRARRRQQAAV